MSWLGEKVVTMFTTPRGLLFFVVVFGGYVHHIVVSSAQEEWSLLILGVIIPPFGIVNGWGVLLEFW